LRNIRGGGASVWLKAQGGCVAISFSQRLIVVALLMPVLAAPTQTVRATSASNVAPANNGADFVPKGLSRLTAHASWHTDFTFDRSMLALTGKLEGLDEPTRQAIARLNAVTVHSYRYAKPGVYDAAEVDSIRAQYDALGWKHVVSKKGHAGPEASGPDTIGPDRVAVPGRTDLWIRMDGMNVAGVAVLLAEPSSLNLVAVSGDISTVDLLRLRGHLGIPKFDPDDIGK
jgi:hypothetical protein